MTEWMNTEKAIVEDMISRRPDLEGCLEGMQAFHTALTDCFDRGRFLFTCGNGGSNADALHIVGELCKSFERKRTLEPDFAKRLQDMPCGADLVNHLEAGFPALALGLNSPLKTAIENDCALPNMAFAQELNALVHKGDMLLAISTSGNAQNCLMAMSVAKAHHATTAVLSGPGGGRMADYADIVIKAPGGSTKVIQEAHVVIWHTLCLLVEARYFPELR